MTIKPVLFVIVVGLMLSGRSIVSAGGPVYVAAGAPLLWSGQTIPYRVDRGALGSIPEPAISKIVGDAFRTWAVVPTASLKLLPTALGEDVNTPKRYLDLLEDETAGNLVIFDNSGDIIDRVSGPGARKYVFAVTTVWPQQHHLARFIMVVNGRLAQNTPGARSTLVHEFGHALGLDHSQINASFARNGNVSDDEFLPTMFPGSVDDDSRLMNLNPDDAAWVSRLYPAPSLNGTGGFDRQFGTIRGRVIRRNKSAVLGANVVAIAMVQGADDPMQRYSCVSDYLMNRDGSFELSVLPGNYRLAVEPIKRTFRGASAVGPYAMTLADASFRNPVTPTNFPTVAVTAGKTTDVGILEVQ